MDKWFGNFRDKFDIDISDELLSQVLTHPSYTNVDPQALHYDRLETLGDAVLDVIITAELINETPDILSGVLTTRRSIKVNNTTLSELGKYLDLPPIIRTAPDYNMGRKELADIVEAIFGGLYLHGEMKSCLHFYQQIKPKLDELVKKYDDEVVYNPISKLQEYCQKHNYELPSYSKVDQKGPDHQPTFVFSVELNLPEGKICAQGNGRTKKEARAAAARKLMSFISDDQKIPS